MADYEVIEGGGRLVRDPDGKLDTLLAQVEVEGRTGRQANKQGSIPPPVLVPFMPGGEGRARRGGRARVCLGRALAGGHRAR